MVPASFPDATPPVVESVGRWSRGRPAALAVVDTSTSPPRTWTWRELSGEAEAAAAALGTIGIGPGEPIALKLPNWGVAVVSALAVLRAGAVCFPLPAGLGERETRLALEEAGARVLLAPERAGLAEHEVVIHPVMRWRAGRRTGAGRRGAGGGQLAFTSGTTGRAKLVRHRDGVLTRATRMAARRLRLTATDRVLVASPLGHHSGFLYGTWLAWDSGCTQVLSGGWDPERALAAIAGWRATFTQLAPAHLSDLLAAVAAGGAAPSALRACVVTGAPVADRLAEEAERALGATVCRAWGSTESCMATLGSAADPPGTRHATDGRALEGVRLRVTGDGGEVLGSGREGRLEVTSPCLFEGYGAAPPFDRAGFTPDGWYRSGDLATLDGSGHLRLTGRVGDIVNRGGVKVPAGLVEHLLAEHPAVAAVAVTGVPDDRLGERACAFVVVAPGHELGLDDLRRHLAARGVTKHYWPELLEIVASLPRSAAGKVRKSELRRGVAHVR